MLVDTHCHLDFDVFKDDLEKVLERCKERKVNCLQTISTTRTEFYKVKNIIEKYDFIYGSFGIHPCNVKEEGVLSSEEIIEFTNHNKVISIGETGLDYYHDKSNIDNQIESFINHIDAARITGLPLIIHTRDAEEDTLKILESELKKGPFKALIHCFTASKEFGKKCIELGVYISVSGIITFKNAESIRDAIKDVPLEFLLVETDSPYLAPNPNRGKRNEPSFVADTAAYMANFKEISLETFAKITTDNFYKLFSKARR